MKHTRLDFHSKNITRLIARQVSRFQQCLQQLGLHLLHLPRVALGDGTLVITQDRHLHGHYVMMNTTHANYGNLEEIK